jgi:hypothetical protein
VPENGSFLVISWCRIGETSAARALDRQDELQARICQQRIANKVQEAGLSGTTAGE